MTIFSKTAFGDCGIGTIFTVILPFADDELLFMLLEEEALDLLVSCDNFSTKGEIKSVIFLLVGLDETFVSFEDAAREQDRVLLLKVVMFILLSITFT